MPMPYGGVRRRKAPPVSQTDALGAALLKLQEKTGHKLTEDEKVIPDGMTFRQWCEKLGHAGLKVDGKPFTLEDRPAMAWLYDQIPSTRQEAYRRVLVLMKCAQVGFTVMEMLATIYLGLKFQPSTIGMFLPDMNLAQLKSTERFMPIVRTVPEAHALMTMDSADGSGRKRGEGNVNRRRLGESLFIFSWTSGRATTESIPMDFLSFDEVQEMTLPQMEKTMERLSASSYRYTLMGSTANWPELDIHHWYKLGTQHQFQTECPVCLKARALDDYFPECIRWNPERPDEMTGRPGAYSYVCEDGHWIEDPQRGQWVPANPDARITSAHFTQMLSPTITPGEIMDKWVNSTDKKNFHNRVLGKPFLDPSQIPVTLEHMARCVEVGRAVGVQWKKRARGAFMGIDQMGNFNVVVIKERLPDGRQATIHLEEIYSADPFERCDELMKDYGIAACVVEINPNYNDVKRFANRHLGRVFICNSFDALKDDMIKWGDAPKLDTSDRRTDEQERDRYTVRIDQFKVMQTSMAKFTAKDPLCLFPDPQELQQEVVEKKGRAMAAIAPRAFHHFTKTALVVEKDEETNKYKKVVRKVGIDPHFSYANLLCDVAFARAHGTATFIIPEELPGPEELAVKAMEKNMPGMPGHVVRMLEGLPAGVCGRCTAYPLEGDDVSPEGLCSVREMMVAARDPACDYFIEAS